MVANPIPPFDVSQTNGGRKLTVKVQEAPGDFHTFQADGDGASGWAFRFDEGSGTYQWRYGRSDIYAPVKMSSGLSSWTLEDGTPVGPGAMQLNVIHVKVHDNKHRAIDLLALDDKVRDLEARIVALGG